MLLITGGSGFVGQNLARFFAPRRKTVTTYHTQPLPNSLGPSLQLDVTDADATFSTLEREHPEVVIHAAGNKNVKFCEQYPEAAHRVNGIGTQNVARACQRIGATLIYISTDLVFSCAEGNYREDDVPQPTLAYGRSKLAGERFALEACDQVAICRSGGIYGRRSPLLKWFTDEIATGKTVECFTDIFNTPTYVDNLAEMFEAILEKELLGYFHVVGSERVSRYQFFREYGTVFDLDVNLIAPVEAPKDDESLLLQTDSSLASDASAKKIGVHFDSVSEGFKRLELDTD
ncbi:MAG: SDR family oxidoreductase [Pyrinomonadaceae bacterium]